MKYASACFGLSLLASVFLGGCGPDAATFTAPDRAAGTRAPMTASCGDSGEIRCLLPWPSNAYSVADEATPTGIRVKVDPSGFRVEDDSTSYSLADGFSRLTPLMVGFDTVLDPATIGTLEKGPVHLILAQKDHPKFGEKIPVRIRLTTDDAPVTQTLLAAYPLRPLEPAADYVVAVTNELKDLDGAAIKPSRDTEVALDRAEPASQKEADLRGYHAPTRQIIANAGLDPANIVRIFDFTTRSMADGTHYLAEMREAAVAAVDKGDVQVVIDKVTPNASAVLAITVEGRLTGLPAFFEEDGDLALGPDGKIKQTGTREAPFRAIVPVGSGEYRFVLYGHGTGGDYTDDSFDELLGQNGIGKVAIRFNGWTNSELIATFAGLVRMAEATHRVSALTMHAVAAAAAVQHSMGTILGDVLAGAKIDGTDNPAAGRRPDVSIPVWTGGSLGGTMGLLYVSMDPTMKYGVVNVPGAGWTHFIPGSQTYGTIRGLLKTSYGTDIDVLHALLMSQTNFDNIDGGAWAGQVPGDPSVLLAQESIGDPILPNEGTEMLAVVTDALHIGKAITPILGLETGTEAVERTALTQYQVPAGGDALDIHGFAARSGPAGDAAREQITTFINSAWAGQAKITIPAACTGGSCDFSK